MTPATPVPPEPPARRLAAVWFADIVGFSTAAARDETAALRVVEAFHACAEAHVTSHRGRVVKRIGDAVLADFASTEAALRAALALIAAFSDAQLRIGVHTGEIVTTPDGDVYGDGVNTASRLQREALPGQVIVSDDVWHQLRSRPRDFAFEYVDSRTLRGAEYPLALYRAFSPGDSPSRSAVVPALGKRRGVVPHLRRIGNVAWNRRRVFVGLFLLTIISLVVWQMRVRTAAAFPSGGWALLADFDDGTAVGGMDAALTTAFTVAVEQSAYVNLATGQRVDNALRRMRRDIDAPLDAATARELAIREGLSLVLLPTVAAVGDNYLIALRIEEPGSGDHLKTLSVRASGRDAILDALDELAIELRTFLGESSRAISQRRQPLETATTASLEALQQYSLGFAAQRRARYPEAKVYFTNAINLDSTFARALASLGVLEWEKGLEYEAGAHEFADFDPDRGKQLLRRAMSHIGDATERERLGTQAVYAFAVEGNLSAAIEHYRLRLAQYPEDYVSYNNLGRLYFYEGRHEESVAAYKEVVRIDPTLTGAYDGIVATYLYSLGQVDSALLWARRQVAMDSTYFRAYDLLGWAYIGRDSLAQAARAFARAVTLNPDYSLARFRLAHTRRLLGDYAGAIAALQEVLARDTVDRSIFYDLGATYGLQGNDSMMGRFLQHWRTRATADVRSAPTPEGHFMLAAAAFRLGEDWRSEEETSRGLTLLNRGTASTPARAAARSWLGIDSIGYFELAALRSVQNRPDEALAVLASAREHGLTNMIWLLVHPDFHSLRSDPRFLNLVRQAIGRDD